METEKPHNPNRERHPLKIPNWGGLFQANLAKNILAVIIGLILSFLILESLLRFWQPFEMRIRGDRIILPINKRYIIKNNNYNPRLEKTIIHTKNSLGFRGEELPQYASDSLSIICIGGSTTECSYLSDGKTWPDILALKLHNNFDKLWLNNAGLDGTSTYAHIILMEDYIIKLKPKVLLFMIGVNDRLKVNFDKFDTAIFKKINLTSFKGCLKSLANKSDVINLALYFYRFMRTPTAHTYIDFEKASTVASDYKPLSALIDERSLEHYRQRVDKITEICLKNSIDPVFITQAAIYGNIIDDVTGVDFSRLNVEGTNGIIAWELLERYNNILHNSAKENDLMLIDLGREMPKSSLFFYDFYHFTEEGAEKAADIIYQMLYPYLQKKYKKYLRVDQQN